MSTKRSKSPKIPKETQIIQQIKQVAQSQSAGQAPSAVQPNVSQQVAIPYDFSKMHLHIGIPAYGGQITEPCFTSFVRFVLAAQQIGLHWSLDTMVNESLITRARNNLVAKMMTNEKATHFMFIDADIRFEPEAIFNMMACDKDLIGGLYPKKKLPIDFVINLQRETKIQGDIFTVDTIGTGFMMFKREVIEKLIAAHPESKYVDDVGLGKQYEPFMYNIFDTMIDENQHLLSEDWTVCRRWTALGGDIWAHSKVKLSHVGHYEFQPDMSKMPNFSNATPVQTTQNKE